MESRLALFLIGPPRIERDGLPVKLGRRKAIALLAYLAVSGERHRRDSLVNLLWPEYDTARGRSALRRTLYALRKALPGDWLVVDREQIGLNPNADLWIDVRQFRQHLAGCEAHGHPAVEVCPECVVPLTEAVALVRGEFFSGFGLKDSFNFDDWQLLQAEALRRELAGALDRLVRWHGAQREFEPALAFARRKLALDPLDEPAHRQLMRLYAWSGQRPAALRQYDECVAVLEDQLGVPPQEATTELCAAIQEGRAPPPPGEEGEPPGSARSLTEPRGEPPSFLQSEEEQFEQPLFVAREPELAQLEGHLEAALSGQGRVVFVTGDAGSGKTALVQEFARRAQDAHPDLISAGGHGNAQTGVGDPYLPFREILGLLTGDVEAQWEAGAMTREQARRLWQTLPLAAQALVETGPDLMGTFVLLPALLSRATTSAPDKPTWLVRLEELRARQPAGAGTQSPQQSDLFEQYTRVLQALARGAPLVLVVDDLQWADPGSISLLFHLGRQLAGARILIIGAYRPEEVSLGRDGTRHPLEPVINELQRHFGDIAVNLHRTKSRDFVEALLDSEPNRLGTPFREMLHRQTRGHPLFTIELLHGLQERGDLLQDSEGRWQEGPTLDWETLPARVEAVIAERINRLPEPLQAVLQTASVEGEDFTAEVVAQVLGTGEREIVRQLSNELDRKHRLVRTQALELLGSRRLSRYRFRHHLFQKFLYDSMDGAERAYLHEDVGNVLEEWYGDQTSDISVELARHFQEARIVDKAIQYLHKAGDRAAQLSAYKEATAHLTTALDLLLTLPDSPQRAQQELGLQLSLALAWKPIIPGREGEEALTRARELCHQTGETTQLGQILGELLIVPYVRAEHQRARRLGEEALGLAQQSGDPLLVTLGHWQLGFVLFALGEFTAAHTHCQQALSFYDPDQHHRSFVNLRGSDPGVSALAYDACCLWCLGFPEQASKRSQEALDLARELDHAFSRADVLCFAGCVFNHMRRDARALEINGKALTRLSRDMGFSSFEGTGISYWGAALSKMGQLREGMDQLRAGLAGRDAYGTGSYSTGFMGALGEAQSLAGQPQAGLSTLNEALARVEETDERYYEAELQRVRAELLLSQGRDASASAAAEAGFLKAIEVARRQSAKSWELRATIDLARLWQEQGRAEEALQMLAEIYDWFTEGFDTPDLLEAKALLDELSRA